MTPSFRETPWYEAWTIAFSSPCEHRHSSSAVPDAARLLQRGHPPSLQFRVPRGVPLYPVDTTRLSRTMIAATFRFMQFDREATTFAMFMKYSSQLGLCTSLNNWTSSWS